MLLHGSKSSCSFLPSSSSSSSAEIMQPEPKSKPEPVIKVEDKIQFSSATVVKFDVRVKAEDELEKEKEEDIFQRLSQLLNEPESECTNTIGTTFEQQNVEFELNQEEEEQEDVWMNESEHNIPDPSEPNFNFNEMELSPKINMIPSNPTSTNFGSPSPVSTRSNSDCHVFRDGRRTYKVYKCDRCPYKTSYENRLATHLCSRKSPPSSTKKSTFPCHLCSAIATKKANLRRHILNVHSSPFKCQDPGCDYTVKRSSKNDIKRHLENSHLKSPQEIEIILKDALAPLDSSPFFSISANQIPIPVPESDSSTKTNNNNRITTNFIRSNARSSSRVNQIPGSIQLEIQSNCDNRVAGGLKIFYKDKWVYKCVRCDYKTHYENYLQTHPCSNNKSTKSSPSSSSSFSNKKTTTFPCHLCSVTTSNLRRHILNAHSSPFKCQESGCTYTFKQTRKHDFKIHLQYGHLKSPQEIATIFKKALAPSSSSYSPSSSAKQVQMPIPIPVPELSPKILTTDINLSPTSANFSTQTPILVSTQSNSNCNVFPRPGQGKIFYKMYKCDRCDYKTNYEYHLQAHLRTHNSIKSASSASPRTNKKKRRFPCHLCSLIASNTFNLRQHVQNVHEEKCVLKCPEKGCGYSTHKKSTLKLHAFSRHGKTEEDLPIFSCSPSSSFSSNSEANQVPVSESEPESKQKPVTSESSTSNFSSPTLVSIRSSSSCHVIPGPPKISYKVYKCDLCEYKTNYEYHLQAHLRTHKSSPTKKTRRTLTCHLCSVMAHTTFNLKKHMHNVHEAHEKCELECSESGCGYTTKNTFTLKHHAFSRHGKTEDLPILTCSLCPYKTVEKAALQQHVDNVHVRLLALTFACHVCPFKTGGKGHFQRHFALVHPKLRPYKCPEIGSGCDYAAKEEISFKKHMRASHKKSQKEINTIWKDVSSYYNSLVVRVPTSKSKSESESESESELSTKATNKIAPCSKNVEAESKSNLKSKRVKSCKIANAILFECENCEFYTKQQKQIAAHLYNQHNLPRVTLQLQLFKEKLKRS